MGPGHYENFPVASWLCPPRLRPPILAIYHFARTADDIADEGSAAPQQRLAELAQYRRELDAALAGRPLESRWSWVYRPLAEQASHFALPGRWLHALLDAFEQDVHNPSYADRAALLAYCARSANPVGRLLLHLYGIDDERSLQQSDDICTALQLINFWQDLSVDGPRGRLYVPRADLEHHGLAIEDLRRARDSAAGRALVRELCTWARSLMLRGAGLPFVLPGRAGWELRLVVQGGLRVLERMARMDHATLAARPKLAASDVPLLLWRAWRMRAAAPAAERAGAR
jgi:squalene synthase HpnC